MRDEFIACGLNDREYQVLMHLLSAGPRTAGSVARSLKAKRPTIYSALEGLEKQGLVEAQKKKGAAIFAAIPVEDLTKVMLENAREKLNRVEGATQLLKPRLARFSNKRSAQVGTFEVSQIESTLEYLLLLKKHLVLENYCAIWNPQVAIYSENVRSSVSQFLKETGKRQNHIRDILVKGSECEWYCEQITNKNHQVRKIEDSSEVLADLIILADSVIVSLNVPEHERAIKIKNQEYASFMLWFFNSLWKKLK